MLNIILANEQEFSKKINWILYLEPEVVTCVQVIIGQSNGSYTQFDDVS